jgi:hypothetical protein
MKLRRDISCLLSGGFAGAAGFWEDTAGRAVVAEGGFVAAVATGACVPMGVPTDGCAVVPTVGLGAPTGVPTDGFGEEGAG